MALLPFLTLLPLLSTNAMSSTGKPAIEPQLLSVEHFKNIRTPQECAALLKHAVEVVKSDQYMDAALRVVLRIASEKPTAGAELGDFGVCGLLDSVLGQKLQDPNLCRLTLEIILLLITQKGPDTGAQSQQRSIVLAAVAGMVGNADAQTNIRRLSTSATIFRIIKACHTHCSDASMILLGLKSLHYIISEAGRYHSPSYFILIFFFSVFVVVFAAEQQTSVY